MIRILHCVNQMNRAGLETQLMNVYRQVDRQEIQFDFLTHRPTAGEYDRQIEAMGGRIFYARRLYPWNYPAYFREMRGFFREHPEYQIVHSHVDAMSFLPLMAAKQAKVPVRIAHSHSTAIDRDGKYPLKQLFRHLLPAAATHGVACSQKAGKFLFRKQPFAVLPNGVSVETFAFDASVRREVRRMLGLENKLVVGHAGRLTMAKNQDFLLKVFKAVASRRDSILLLAGSGEREQQLRQLAAELGIGEQVRFLGSREDLHRLYQAMDVFLLPSRYEGMPLVALEAQAAGLPCLFSDRVSREVAFSDGCQFLPLEESPQIWAEAVLRVAGRRYVPEDCPFAIPDTARQWTDFYKKEWEALW